jgi:2-(1,2-epoxy-1,2-dihydrophenyl)acetyl-CoA isomerase
VTDFKAPIVIAVTGPAAGAGFSLALIGDHVIAGESAKFTMA